MSKRPHRQNKGDRLIHPGASADEIRCDHAVAPFDRVAREMERRWGIDRLPELVSPATAQRYGAAIALLNEALAANDPQRCADMAANCIRGMEKMDAEARILGHQPLPGEFWLAEADGLQFGITKEAGDWPGIQAAYPGLVTYTLREVALALAHYRATGLAFHAVKAAIPGAQITEIRQSPLAEELDDEILF